MPQLTQEQIDRNRLINEINRENKAQREEERKREQQAKKKERSKSVKGDPLVLKIDKWLDRFRP